MTPLMDEFLNNCRRSAIDFFWRASAEDRLSGCPGLKYGKIL